MFTIPASWSFFLSDDPLFRSIQLGLIIVAVLDVFLILFTTRDIILRSHSFVYQLFAILLVAFLPFVGFFVYMLIRPSRTVSERETDAMLRAVLDSQKSVGMGGGEGIGFPKMEVEELAPLPHQPL